MLTKRHPDCEIHANGDTKSGRCWNCIFVCDDCGVEHIGMQHRFTDCIANLKAQLAVLQWREIMEQDLLKR